jgi:excinuclease ABC subunit C
MTLDEFHALDLPDQPGVYSFVNNEGVVLYVGKATSLRSRVRSYFANDLLKTRGKHIVDMVTLSHSVRVQMTDTVLEALLLEAAEIKRLQPKFNTREKDDRSANLVVITDEDFPKIVVERERTHRAGGKGMARVLREYGPFLDGASLRIALRILREALPFRTSCTPDQGKPCFDRQIGLCPGVCTGEISREEYRRRVSDIVRFFEGKKSSVIRGLRGAMMRHAESLEFERAAECKRRIFALEHLNDSALIRDDVRDHASAIATSRRRPFRIEAFDVAHLHGKSQTAAMTVVSSGVRAPEEYRKFRIKTRAEENDDLAHLDEVLRRRFAHEEWSFPDLIVVDGGEPHRRRAMRVIKELAIPIPVVSVVKDERHKPLRVLGPEAIATRHQKAILLANAEAHRFAIAYHRLLRDSIVVPKKVR